MAGLPEAAALSPHMGCSWTTAGHSEHTGAALGAAVTALDVHVYAYLHIAVEKDRIEISRQSLFDANISSGSLCKPTLYANPLPRWKEV